MATIFDDLSEDQQEAADEALNEIESSCSLRELTLEDAFKIGYAHAIQNHVKGKL